MGKGAAAWAIPIPCVSEFLRVVTHPRLFDVPHTPEQACTAVERILESPSVRLLLPGARFWPLLAEAIRESDVMGNLVFDAQIVALCREAGVRALLTEDRDFARFPGFATERL